MQNLGKQYHNKKLNFLKKVPASKLLLIWHQCDSWEYCKGKRKHCKFSTSKEKKNQKSSVIYIAVNCMEFCWMWLQKLGSHSKSIEEISVMGMQYSYIMQRKKFKFCMGKKYTNISKTVKQTPNTNTSQIQAQILVLQVGKVSGGHQKFPFVLYFNLAVATVPI